MSDVRKKVYIEGDASGYEETTKRMENSGNALYTRLKKEAEEYSDDLKEQAIYIEKLLNLESRRLNEITRQNRQYLEIQKESDLENVESMYEKNTIEKKYDDLLAQNKVEDYIGKQEILEAKQLSEVDYGATRLKKKKPIDQEIEEESRDAQESDLRRGMEKARRFSGRFTSALTAGLGLGMGFGIFGILFSMVKESVELEKSMKDLDAVMGDVNKNSLGAASAIGKTSAQMAELSKMTAIESGGMYRQRTTDVALQLANYAKAFGVDENLLMKTLGAGRMGGANISSELVDLLREMLKTNTVEKGNMAKLGEKIEYWSRLNNVQSQQLISVIPGLSTIILGAFEGTKLPIMSDQRQMDMIEGMNRAITSPDNDFKRAFILDSLRTGDYFGTMVRMEQGIFGKGNVRDIITNMIKKFGEGEGSDEKLALAYSEFWGMTKQRAQFYVKNLLRNKEALEKFFESFDRIADITNEFEKLEQEKVNLSEDEYKKRADELNKKYSISQKVLQEEYGITISDTATQMTSTKEKIVAELKNLMAKQGGPILEGLGEIIGNQDFKEALTTLTTGISWVATNVLKVAAEIIKEAAPIIKEAAILFMEGVRVLLDFLGVNMVAEEDRKKAIQQVKESKEQIFESPEYKKLPKEEQEKIKKDFDTFSKLADMSIERSKSKDTILQGTTNLPVLNFGFSKVIKDLQNEVGIGYYSQLINQVENYTAKLKGDWFGKKEKKIYDEYEEKKIESQKTGKEIEQVPGRNYDVIQSDISQKEEKDYGMYRTQILWELNRESKKKGNEGYKDLINFIEKNIAERDLNYDEKVNKDDTKILKDLYLRGKQIFKQKEFTVEQKNDLLYDIYEKLIDALKQNTDNTKENTKSMNTQKVLDLAGSRGEEN